MALLWVDGFESYGSVNAAPSPTNVMGTKYNVENEANFTINEGRVSGLKCVTVTTVGSVIATPALTSNRTLICGVAFKLSATSEASYSLLSFRVPSLDGATVGFSCMDVWISGNTDLKVVRGGTTLNTTSSLGLTSNTWYYLEFKVYCDNSSGTYDVELDGVSVLSGTGVDTQFGSLNYYTSVALIGVAGTVDISYDDMYICDGSTGDNNAILGDCTVKDLRPNGDASGNWTANSEASKYLEVDEAARDDDSFIYTGTTCNLKIFEYTNAPVSLYVKGMMVNTEVQLDSNKGIGYKHVSQQGTGTVNESSINCPAGLDDIQTHTEIFDKDPDDSSWNTSLMQGVRFGMEML